jgi:hypothetical protein
MAAKAPDSAPLRLPVQKTRRPKVGCPGDAETRRGGEGGPILRQGFGGQEPEKSDATQGVPTRVMHRGLTVADMPGKAGERQMRFALFKRGQWPPRQWRVPVALAGVGLLQMIEERCAMFGAHARKATPVREANRKAAEDAETRGGERRGDAERKGGAQAA